MCEKSKASLREIYQIDSRGTGEKILEEQRRGSWVDFLMSSPSCCQLLMNPFLKDSSKLDDTKIDSRGTGEKVLE